MTQESFNSSFTKGFHSSAKDGPGSGGHSQWGNRSAAAVAGGGLQAGEAGAGLRAGGLAASGVVAGKSRDRVSTYVGGPLSAKLWMPLPLASPSEVRARRGVASPSRSTADAGGAARDGAAGGAPIAAAAFGEQVPDYRPGTWDHRSRFLPSLQGADDNPLIAERFRHCVAARDLAAVKLMLHEGVQPDMSIAPLRRTALHIAATHGDVLMAQVLLSFSADPKQLDTTPPSHINRLGGIAPMDIAKQRNDIPLMHLFSMGLPAEPAGRSMPGQSQRVDSAPVRLDLGPRPPPRRSRQPLRVTPIAKESDFMRSPHTHR